MLNSNISPTCPHEMVNFGPLTAEVCWRVFGTPANFNGFRVSASLHVTAGTSLNGGQPNFARYLAVSWSGTDTFSRACPVTEFCHMQNSLCVQLLRSPILAALLHGTRAVGVNESLQRRTRNGITAGRPSRWASAHILVYCYVKVISRILKLLRPTSSCPIDAM